MTRSRGLNRLSAKKVASALKPGKYSDGQGLYLMVDKAKNKRWALVYSRGGRYQAKRTELGLGSARDVTLAEAREKAATCWTGVVPS